MRKSNFKTVGFANFNNKNYSDVINLLYIIKISLLKTNMMRLRTKITLWRHDRVPERDYSVTKWAWSKTHLHALFNPTKSEVEVLITLCFRAIFPANILENCLHSFIQKWFLSAIHSHIFWRKKFKMLLLVNLHAQSELPMETFPLNLSS